MLFAQFFQHSYDYKSGTYDKTKLIEACGDRSVVILDGRERQETHQAIARSECTKRGYKAWQLCKGDSFTRSNPITEVKEV